MRRGALLALAVVLAGCGGSGGASISKDDLPKLALHRADLPAGFAEFADGPQGRTDLHPGPREDPGRFDRVGGWIARYRKPGAPVESPGAHVVESRADLFPSSDGAKQDLKAYEDEYEQLPQEVGVQRLEAPDVGDGAAAFRFGSGLDRFVLLAWREGNATGSVLVEGSSVTLADAAALARKQQARMAAAAG
jgi:hypothetical protein